MVAALVISDYLKVDFCHFPRATSQPQYIFNVINSLGNYVYINIYYNPISRILRGEIHRRRA